MALGKYVQGRKKSSNIKVCGALWLPNRPGISVSRVCIKYTLLPIPGSLSVGRDRFASGYLPSAICLRLFASGYLRFAPVPRRSGS
jgi:hypothetical protein